MSEEAHFFHLTATDERRPQARHKLSAVRFFVCGYSASELRLFLAPSSTTAKDDGQGEVCSNCADVTSALLPVCVCLWLAKSNNNNTMFGNESFIGFCGLCGGG